MTPASLHDFFFASAGVAGALIGLLFVAISVERERLVGDDADQVHRIRASAALTAFSNAFAISMFVLIPGASLGWTALVVGTGGLAFVAGSLLSLRRWHRRKEVAMRDVLFLVGQVVVFALQLSYGIRLLVNDEHDKGAATGVAVLVAVCFLIGVARAWELIGGPEIGLAHEVGALVRARREAAREDPPQNAFGD
jgi:hypothetical protein